jgi:putative pyruvate formate lyase activating enzyme
MVVNYEEAELIPSHQVFFSGCNLRCEFCAVLEWCEEPQAAPELQVDGIAAAVEKHLGQGARTLNILGGEPSVSIGGILELLARVRPEVQLVWNSNMYFNPPVFQMLSGLVEVWLADFKCGNGRCARSMLGAPEYVETVTANLKTAETRAEVIIRHVVLPGHRVCCTRPILQWIAREMPKVKVSLKGDYLPPVQALHAPVEYLKEEEFQDSLEYAKQLDLNLIS